MVAFQLLEEDTQNPHRFATYDCVASAGDLVDELAERVRRLYVDPTELHDALAQAVSGLEDVADTERLHELLERVTTAVVPTPSTNPDMPAHLDLARNEIAEVIAYEAVEKIHGAVIPAERIREKEVPGLPTRGLDLLGLLPPPTLSLVVSEVKASSSAASPPGVVGSGKDSLHSQTKAMVQDLDRLLVELNWCLKHCRDDELRGLVAQAMLLISFGQLPIVAVPVLVRPADKQQSPSDYGCFRDDPSGYPPAAIQFCVARIEGTLEELAAAVYEKARTAQ